MHSDWPAQVPQFFIRVAVFDLSVLALKEVTLAELMGVDCISHFKHLVLTILRVKLNGAFFLIDYEAWDGRAEEEVLLWLLLRLLLLSFPIFCWHYLRCLITGGRLLEEVC